MRSFRTTTIINMLRSPFLWSLVAGSLAILATFLKCADWELDFFFTSDTLYLPSIYRDIFFDGGRLSDWSLNAAPNFFPDMGLYFLLNWLFGDLRWAHFIFPIIQFLLIAVLFRAIVRRVTPGIGDWPPTLGVLLLTVVILTAWWGHDFGFAFHLLVNSFHAGAFVNTLLCTWLLLRAYDSNGIWPVILLALAVATAAISDKLFWVMFVVPASLVCLVLAIGSAARRRLLMLAITIGATAFAAHRLLMFVDEALPLRIENPYAYLAFDRVVFSWWQFVEMLRVYLLANPLVSGTIALGLVVTVVAIIIGIRRCLRWFTTPPEKRPLGSERMELVVWMTALFFPFVLLAPVVNGSFDGLDSLRYNFAVFALAPMVAGLLLGRRWSLLGRGLALVGLTGIGVPSLWVCLSSGSSGYAHLSEYKPAVVNTFDELTRGMGLRRGVANYWMAKRITFFSDQNVVVLPTHPQVGMHVHVNRPAMYLDGTFDFVILHKELPKGDMIRIFHQDTGFFAKDDVEVMLTRPWRFDPATEKPAVNVH